jgi:hypothetical protein
MTGIILEIRVDKNEKGFNLISRFKEDFLNLPR